MKRWIKKNKIEIEIVVELNTANAVAASKVPNIEYRSNLKPEWQLTKAQFEDYKNFMKSAISIIYNFGFDIVDEYQSPVSYSYYIQFTPQPYKGFEDDTLELDVKFRLSDHFNESTALTEDVEEDTDRNLKIPQSGVLFKSFVVEGVRHTDVASALLDIKRICQDLKVGDYSKFY